MVSMFQLQARVDPDSQWIGHAPNLWRPYSLKFLLQLRYSWNFITASDWL